jgi:general stress protein YciG
MADKQNTQSGNRGFASMDDEKQREIASKGGQAAHEQGTAHEFDSKEAAEAGRKGGQSSHGNQGGNQGNQGNQGGNQGNQGSQGGNQGNNRGGNR